VWYVGSNFPGLIPIFTAYLDVFDAAKPGSDLWKWD
jgi:hypothetical protein